MRVASRSDRGLVRENNEDYLLADPERGIFLLADGMGGGPAGELASSLAVEAAHGSLVRQLAGEPLITGLLLAEALAAAHSAVAKRALADPELTGMGTTLEIMLVRGAEAYSCHVGDSRLYLLREGVLHQLTTDDNYAAVLARERNLRPEQVPSAFRHMLTQAVGVSEEIIPELRGIALKPGDLLMLASDGLHGTLKDAEIAGIMGREANLEAIAAALVQAANDQGGQDNVSVLLVEPLPALAPGTIPASSAPR
jgi:protein phosphatase